MKIGKTIRSFFTLFLFISALFLYDCSNAPVAEAETIGTGSETVGVIFKSDSTFAIDALIRFIDVNAIAMPNSAVHVDSVYSDTLGRYSFITIPDGDYNVFGEEGGELSFRGNLHIENGSVGVDTLRDTLSVSGTLCGIVRHRYHNDSRYILGLIPGTDRYMVPEDSSGVFRLENFAHGTYRIRLLSLLPDYIPLDTVFYIIAGITDTLSDTMYLEYSGIPPVTGMNIALDTNFQVVNLSWDRIDSALVSGYNIYRSEAVQNFTLLTQAPVTDTFFADSNAISGRRYSYKVAGVKDGMEGPVSGIKTMIIAGLYDSVGVFGGTGTGDGQFNSIGGMAFTQDSQVLICDIFNNRIQVFDFDLNFITTFGDIGHDSVILKCPIDIAVGPENCIYVAEYENHRIHKFDASFAHTLTWGKQGSGIGEFNKPRSITVDANLSVYVIDEANKRIQKFDSSGSYLGNIGAYGTGKGNFLNPRVIRCDMLGKIFIADGDMNTVLVYDTSGLYLCCSENTIIIPFTASVETQTNTLYIAEHKGGKIFGLQSNGDIIFRWSLSPGIIDALIVLPNDNLWIGKDNSVTVFKKNLNAP